MLRRIVFASLFSVLILFLQSGLCESAEAGKPRLPLQVTISAAGIDTGASIKPSDTLWFTVEAIPLIEAHTLQITIELLDGAELVSGELFWSGPVHKGERKIMNLAVRASQSGGGGLRARAAIVNPGNRPIEAASQFSLGTVQKSTKPKTTPAVNKDRRGRTIQEYREEQQGNR